MNGAQPSWLPNSNQTTPQTTDVTPLHRVFTPQARLGILFNASNGGGSFDAVLRFTDNSSVSVTINGPDWFGDVDPPLRTPASGLAAQRKLGVYAGTHNTDLGEPENPLNVAEAVVNVDSLVASGRPNVSGKTLASITFQNPHSANSAYPDPATGSGFAIYAVTLGGTTAGASCFANCDQSTTIPFLNVNDFVCFQSQFAAGNTAANCDGSTTIPVLNVNDFVCFQARFAAGCSAP